MYNYRFMSPTERELVVRRRRALHLPLHSPPHGVMGFTNQYFITAACYEHAPIIGTTPERLSQCEEQLLDVCREHGSRIYGWCVLPNHYHVLFSCPDVRIVARELGRFHGRSSFQWNLEDGTRGRKVWFRCFDREIRSERHFWATLNYIHHNPIHHGYVEKWQDWVWSSAEKFIESYGRDRVGEIWREYPILDYGKGWDI